MIRSPRSVAIPLLAPLLFAMVVAPALGNTLAAPGQHKTYMTFVALAAAGLLIPVNCLFAGLGVLTDRQSGQCANCSSHPSAAPRSSSATWRLR
jgi:hypothetical protein